MMITIPDNAYCYRMLAIDNGSNTMGTSIVDLDLRERILRVRYSETCTASKTAGRYEGIADLLGDIHARYEVLYHYLREVLDIYEPNDVIVEGPFVHLNILTYLKLEGSISVIQRAAWDHHWLLGVRKVAPMSAKKAVRSTSYQGKDPVREAVLSLTDVFYDDGIDPRTLDEHCIDSIAVAYYRAQEVLREVYRR